MKGESESSDPVRGMPTWRAGADEDEAMPTSDEPAGSAPDAARELVLGIERGQFHIHFPKRFTNAMRALRLLPYRLYFWLIHKGTGL